MIGIFKKHLFIFFIIVAISLGFLLAVDFFMVLLLMFSIIILGLIIKNLRWGVFLIVFIPVCGQLLRFSVNFMGGGVLILDLVIALFILIYVWQRGSIYWKNEVLIKDNISKYLVLFWAIALFSLFFGASLLSIKELLSSSFYWMRLVMYSSLYFIVKDLFYDLADQKKLLRWIIICGILTALLGFYQLHYFADFLRLKLFEQGWDPHIDRLTSTWLDPNFVGGYLAIVATIVLSMIVKITRSTGRNFIVIVLWSLGFLLLIIAIFYTYSRSAYLALLVGIIVFSILKAKKILIILVLMGVMGFGFSARFQERIDNAWMSFRAFFTESSLTLDPTAQLRVESWRQGGSIFSDNLFFGVGYNTLRYENLKRGFAQFDKHSSSGFDSSLLTIAATTGMCGLIIFVFLLFACIQRFLILINSQNLDYEYLGAGLLASLAAIFLHAIFVNSLLFPFINMYLWILIGLANHKLLFRSD